MRLKKRRLASSNKFVLLDADLTVEGLGLHGTVIDEVNFYVANTRMGLLSHLLIVRRGSGHVRPLMSYTTILTSDSLIFDSLY